VICPSGGLSTGVSSPLCKNISLHPSGKSSLQILAIPPHKRGVGHRHERGEGCGGRGSVLRATGSQGGSMTPRRWRQVRGGLVGPTGRRQTIFAGDGGKTARSPGRARRKPLKPLRAGMPGDSGVLVVTRVRSTNTKCTRGRGCNGHPAFPTPSFGARDSSTTRAHRAARS
jgi:hypothetical protein